MEGKLRLAGKRAIISGGASGIGRATALLFAKEGASVAILDINQKAGEAIADEICSDGGRGLFIRCDVSQGADCHRAVQEAVNTLGGIDILFNNAGVIRRASVPDLEEADWDRVMDVNVKSIYLLSRYAIPHMRAAGGGAIVNTSSGWGLVGGRNAAVYCASKGAVLNLTRAMALDHGPEGIRVNSICPGDVDTNMLREEARQLGQPEADFLSEAAVRPLGRYGQPEEIAQAVLYLVSDEASYVTGHALVIDGGGTAG